jgi:WD40 repeat protein
VASLQLGRASSLPADRPGPRPGTGHLPSDPADLHLTRVSADGFVLLWVPKPSTSDGMISLASSSAFGDSSGAEEGQKENWRVKMMVRPTTNEIYDLAWSPDGAHFIVGSTGKTTVPPGGYILQLADPCHVPRLSDNTAKIYDAASGERLKPLPEFSSHLAEHHVSVFVPRDVHQGDR